MNAAVMAWARRSAGVPELHAAKKAGVSVERLREWESGASRPSIAQLRLLADLYKRPLAVFFFDEVPKDFSVMKYFRRLPESPETRLSPQLATQTRAALVRRDIVLELSAATGDAVPPFSFKVDAGENAAAAASRVRVALGITTEEQFTWRDEGVAYKTWRATVESAGALVFQVTKVRVEEMRGLSAFQRPLPVILINGSDSIRGRMFSLFHELGHLLREEVHVCDWRDESTWAGGTNEVWCNAFAANLLVPADALRGEFVHRGAGTATEPDWDETRRVADRFKVSQEVILRRLLTLNALTESAYKRARKHLLDLDRPVKRRAKGGPSPDLRAVWNLGTPFVRSVLGALHQQRITLSNASDYLDVKVRWLPQIRERVFFGGGAVDEEHAEL